MREQLGDGAAHSLRAARDERDLSRQLPLAREGVQLQRVCRSDRQRHLHPPFRRCRIGVIPGREALQGCAGSSARSMSGSTPSSSSVARIIRRPSGCGAAENWPRSEVRISVPPVELLDPRGELLGILLVERGRDAGDGDVFDERALVEQLPLDVEVLLAQRPVHVGHQELLDAALDRLVLEQPHLLEAEVTGGEADVGLGHEVRTVSASWVRLPSASSTVTPGPGS